MHKWKEVSNVNCTVHVRSYRVTIIGSFDLDVVTEAETLLKSKFGEATVELYASSTGSLPATAQFFVPRTCDLASLKEMLANVRGVANVHAHEERHHA